MFRKFSGAKKSFLQYILGYRKLVFSKVGLGIVVVLLGIFAFSWEWGSDANASAWDFDRILYKTAQLFMLESGVEDSNVWPLIFARLAALWLVVLTAKQLLTALFQSSFDRLRLNHTRRHAVVCGQGRIGNQLVSDLNKQARKKRKWYLPWTWNWMLPAVVVVEIDGEESRVEQLRREGNLVITGDATDKDVLEQSGVVSASQIFIVTGNDDANVEIAFDCIEQLKNHHGIGDTQERQQHSPTQSNQSQKQEERLATRRPLKCVVQLSDPDVQSTFKEWTARITRNVPIDITVFNPAASCGRVLVRDELADHRPRRDETALYVFIGFGPVGQAIALQTAEFAHFENNRRARMLIVDHNYQELSARFRSQYGGFAPDLCDEPDWQRIEFDPAADDWESRVRRPAAVHQVDQPGVEYVSNAIFTPRPGHFKDRLFLQMLHRITTAPGVKPVIVVCSENDRENFDIAAIIANGLGELRNSLLPIYVWLPRQDALRSVIDSRKTPRQTSSGVTNYSLLKAFGACSESASLKTVIDPEITRLAKEMHIVYQQEKCTDESAKNEPSCQDWENLDDSFVESNYSAAAHAVIKEKIARDAGATHDSLDDATLETLAITEHNRWLSNALLEGYTFGERSKELKQRPAITTWPHLTEEDRKFNRDQVKLVWSYLSKRQAANNTSAPDLQS